MRPTGTANAVAAAVLAMAAAGRQGASALLAPSTALPLTPLRTAAAAATTTATTTTATTMTTTAMAARSTDPAAEEAASLSFSDAVGASALGRVRSLAFAVQRASDAFGGGPDGGGGAAGTEAGAAPGVGGDPDRAGGGARTDRRGEYLVQIREGERRSVEDAQAYRDVRASDARDRRGLMVGGFRRQVATLLGLARRRDGDPAGGGGGAIEGADDGLGEVEDRDGVVISALARLENDSKCCGVVVSSCRRVVVSWCCGVAGLRHVSDVDLPPLMPLPSYFCALALTLSPFPPPLNPTARSATPGQLYQRPPAAVLPRAVPPHSVGPCRCGFPRRLF